VARSCSSRVTGWWPLGRPAPQEDRRQPGGGFGRAIFIGTLLDAIPESLVLGMGLAMGGPWGGLLVAVFVSNFPEGVAGR